MSATGRAAVEAASLELRCLKQIADEMSAAEDEVLIERAESLTTTLEMGVARPGLAKKKQSSEA